MLAAAHDPAFAKKMGIPKSVAEDFEAADKKAGKFPPLHAEAPSPLPKRKKPSSGKAMATKMTYTQR